MQTVLIPTDFSITSFDCIPDLCAQQEEKELSLVFVHLFKLSDSISELLMLSRRSKEYEYVSDEFYACCENLKAKFPQVKSIRIEFFYGSRLNTFKDFLEYNAVDGILEPSNCCFTALNKSSIDPSSLIQKCGLPEIKVVKNKTAIVKLPVTTEKQLVPEAPLMAEA